MAAGVSRYVQHLPAMFQEDAFVGQFLLAFERILTGRPGEDDPPDLGPIPPGLESVLDEIEVYFDPKRTTRDDFLPWLADWVATTLREDWDLPTRRGFIASIVPLYKKRGTAEGLQLMLQLYLDPKSDPLITNTQAVKVIEDPSFPPRYFQVRFTVAEHNPQLLAHRAAIATYIIDREKPAHTYYGLRINFPSLEISVPPSLGPDGEPDYVRGVFVGVNTTLGGSDFKP